MKKSVFLYVCPGARKVEARVQDENESFNKHLYKNKARKCDGS